MCLMLNLYIILQYQKKLTLEKLWGHLTGAPKNAGRAKYLSVVRGIILITPQQVGSVGGFF